MGYGDTFVKVIQRLCILFAMSIGVASGACAIGGWRVLTTDPMMHTLPITGLAFFDDVHGWTMTPYELLQTDNGGQTWKPVLLGEERSFLSLCFINPTTGWIVGSQDQDGDYRALIMHTTDGGKSWDQQEAKSVRILTSVKFGDSSRGWALGPKVILYTADGGNTWEEQYRSKSDEGLMSVECVSSQRAWAVADNGTVLHTENGGVTWVRQDVGTDASLQRVRFFGEDGWIVGSRGTLLRTRDGGSSWERQSLDISNDSVLTHIHIIGERGWLIGSPRTMFHTSDGGQTWQRQKSPTDRDLLCLFFLSSHRGQAVKRGRYFASLTNYSVECFPSQENTRSTTPRASPWGGIGARGIIGARGGGVVSAADARVLEA